MNEAAICTVCHQPFPQTQLTSFGDALLCPTCLENSTVLCEHCGQRIWADENAGDAGISLCPSCRESLYTTCTSCGCHVSPSAAYYEDEDDCQEYPYCWCCFNQMQRDSDIHEYSYKPSPIFFGNGNRYFGVELEMDEAGEIGKNACQILRRANQGEELAYCKHDGSLNDGFEIVTHPMTLDYHQQAMPWKALLQEAVNLGYHSHKTSTCGLHVHVNRSAFGDTVAEQEACIARVLYIVEKFWDELLKFSRRTPHQLEQWARRYGYKDQPQDILDHAKKGYNNGRYACVNLSNYKTIEFRIFRGTLKYNTLIATLQLVDKICDVAINLSDEELTPLAWTTFVAGIQEPELVQYLKERRLYVNEPVAEGGEI